MDDTQKVCHIALLEEWCSIVFTVGAFHNELLNFNIDNLVKCADFYISSCKTIEAVQYTFWLVQFSGSVPTKGLLGTVTCRKLSQLHIFILKVFHWWTFCWIMSWVVTESFWILSRLKWNTWCTNSMLKSNSWQHSLRASVVVKNQWYQTVCF